MNWNSKKWIPDLQKAKKKKKQSLNIGLFEHGFKNV